MLSYLFVAIRQIQKLASDGKVVFTFKAIQELFQLELGIDETDIVSILMELNPRDFKEKILSNQSNDWLYVFKPKIFGVQIYLKICLREQYCIVISCHEDKL